jgi:hypothetical protein
VNEEFAETVGTREEEKDVPAPDSAAKPEAPPIAAPRWKDMKRLLGAAWKYLLPVLIFFAAAGRTLRRFFKKDSAPNLALVTALLAIAAAASIGIVHTVTQPRIEANREEAFMAAMGTVFPGQDLRFTRSALGESIYEGRDGEGRLAGFSIRVSVKGNAGEVRMVVGVDTLREVTGVEVVSHREAGSLSAFKNRGVEEALALLEKGVQP